jgi:hypothetical protein
MDGLFKGVLNGLKKILKSLENDDKEICNFFYPDMFDPTTK